MDREAAELIARWRGLKAELDAGEVRLIAVSKYSPDSAVEALASVGQRDFGESRPQALRDRALAYPDLAWHMIGPLQRNKAKYVGRHAAMWHSLESVETAEAVARHVEGRRLPVLVQVNVTGATQQHGVAPEALPDLLHAVHAMPELKLAGLMCMVPADADARAGFRRLRDLREGLADGSLRELCMGMSGDYRLAIEEGATMVRLGSVLFSPDA